MLVVNHHHANPPLVERMSEKRSQPQDVFEEQLSSIRTQLYSYIYSLICNINDADDVYQLTTIVLWKKFDQFDRSRAFSSWAFGIARFEVSNFLKKRSRQRLYFSDELTLQLLETQQSRIENDASAPTVTTEERREILASCVQKLRISDQHLMADCYDNAIEHLDLKRVAEKYSRSVTSIYNSLRRIRKGLFACVQNASDPASKYVYGQKGISTSEDIP